MRADLSYTDIDQGPSGGWTHLRVNIFPDGGVCRLRARGVVRAPLAQVCVVYVHAV